MANDRITSGPVYERVLKDLQASRRCSAHKQRWKVSAEKLLKLFDDPSLTMSDRARVAGVDRRSLGNLYDTYVRPLYSGKSAFERYKEHRANDAAKKKERLETFLSFPRGKPIYKAATAAKHIVEPVLSKHYKGIVLERSVLISGHRCRIFPVTHIYTGARAGDGYGRIQISRSTLAGMAFAIVPILASAGTSDRDILVIPVPVLEAMLFRNPDSNAENLHIPFGWVQRHKKARFRPVDYDHAWHLIPKAPARRP